MDEIKNTIEIFKALGHPLRTKIITLLCRSDLYVELLANSLDIPASTACYHLKILERAGLVVETKIQHYVIYSLNYEIFDIQLKSFFVSKLQTDGVEKYKRKVVNSYIKYGKLNVIPSQIKKKEIIYEYILKDMKFDKFYSEKELCGIIVSYNDDYATIKRDLIGLGYITEKNNYYQRIK